MSLKQQAAAMLPAIERELRRQIKRLDARGTRPFHDMLAYHMGWTNGKDGKPRAGKRIRPLLLLLVTQAVGSRWKDALAAAAAVEIIHNFSLVHDDIQDNSPTRRGRPALWTVHGRALAINAGDALLTIANQAMLDLEKRYPPAVVVEAARIVQDACLDLTRGQYLDLSHQDTNRLTLRDYWTMIGGKTAALLSACTEIGAILGGAGVKSRAGYREFGRLVGAAFQVQPENQQRSTLPRASCRSRWCTAFANEADLRAAGRTRANARGGQRRSGVCWKKKVRTTIPDGKRAALRTRLSRSYAFCGHRGRPVPPWQN